MQLTDDIHRAWKDGGPKALVTRSLRKVVRPFVKIGSLVFIECDLQNPMPERRVVPGVIVREATANDAILFAERDVFFKRFNEGHRCFMGIEEATGKLMNYRWVNPSAAYIPELRRFLMLQPTEVYVYDLKTLPEFRRRGIDAYTRHCI